MRPETLTLLVPDYVSLYPGISELNINQAVSMLYFKAKDRFEEFLPCEARNSLFYNMFSTSLYILLKDQEVTLRSVDGRIKISPDKGYFKQLEQYINHGEPFILSSAYSPMINYSMNILNACVEKNACVENEIYAVTDLDIAYLQFRPHEFFKYPKISKEVIKELSIESFSFRQCPQSIIPEIRKFINEIRYKKIPRIEYDLLFILTQILLKSGIGWREFKERIANVSEYDFSHLQKYYEPFLELENEPMSEPMKTKFETILLYYYSSFDLMTSICRKLDADFAFSISKSSNRWTEHIKLFTTFLDYVSDNNHSVPFWIVC